MHWIDWLIIIIPLAGILWMAVHSRKYIRGVADYLAASRVAGRYVISVADLSQALGVITLIALVEAKYQTGFALTFWEFIAMPVGTIMGLTGYCVYRFRETKALSIGQFLEMRYSRPFRIIAATLRTLSEMLTNAIGPAIATNFFIYYIGLLHSVSIFGMAVPTFAIIVTMMLSLCVIVMWPGGRISLLITDCIQSLLSYPIFVLVGGYIILHFSWATEISPVMLDRVPGESFLNPFDISELRDFNIFALVVIIVSYVLNRASWIGNDTTNSGRTPHEQKMAGILGTWRTGFSTLMCLLIAVMMITLMAHRDFAPQAHEIRLELSEKVSEAAIASPKDRDVVMSNVSAVPVVDHRIGIDPPLSQKNNIDTPYLAAARAALPEDGTGNLEYQNFKTLYHQMMLPVALRNIFPVGLVGIFGLLMVMLMLSCDESRIFNSAATIIQDIVLPLRKKPLGPKGHLRLLRWGTVGVSLFFLVSSLFFVHLDYINMFITIMTAVWLGGAGPIMIFGLYSRFGTTTGAYCSLIFGSGFSILSLFLQRKWADLIYPFLEAHGWIPGLSGFLETVSSPLNPYIEWKMNAVKFPINSYELYFMSMAMGVIAYVVGSLVTYREPFNLERMLHRGKYNLDGDEKPKIQWGWRTFIGKFVGITSEYTVGDKVIAWSVFFYAIIYNFGICFVAVLVWNLISPWPAQWWSHYFYITSVVVTGVVGIVSTFWFGIGGVIDLRQLFRDLRNRADNPLDDGRVEDGVSLADQAAFEDREKPKK